MKTEMKEQDIFLIRDVREELDNQFSPTARSHLWNKAIGEIFDGLYRQFYIQLFIILHERIRVYTSDLNDK